MSRIRRSRVLRDEDERGLVGVPTSDWRACSLRLRKGRLHWHVYCRAANIARFWDLWVCVSFRDMREVSSGLYHEGLDLSMRDVARIEGRMHDWFGVLNQYPPREAYQHTRVMVALVYKAYALVALVVCFSDICRPAVLLSPCWSSFRCLKLESNITSSDSPAPAS